MRFVPESADPANAGLSIVRDLLLPIKERHPDVSYADLWAIAGAAAVEFLGGPRIPVRAGRQDDVDGKRCPMNGRLPDASQGAAHLRAVFCRMGLSDQEIVALSGAHTLGRCHQVRSGFDGPWTSRPLQFDNEYFVNLLKLTWKPRQWDGNFQYQDVETGKLMMLPTDLALRDDPKFRVYVEMYAQDQAAFFTAFAEAYGKLIALGCPPECQPDRLARVPDADKLSAEFRELCMHGSLKPARALSQTAGCNVHALETPSNRSALHKAAFWGHNQLVKFLVNEVKIDVNVQDSHGDTALHDAAKFGHETVAQYLLDGGADITRRNKANDTAYDVAVRHSYQTIANMIKARPHKL